MLFRSVIQQNHQFISIQFHFHTVPLRRIYIYRSRFQLLPVMQVFPLGGIPISLSTSGGALIAGLFFGWLRTKHPTFGRIPEPAVWILNNLGLNMFIAVIGITAGPTFLEGIKEDGFMLFVAGVLATSIPLLLGIWV